MGLFLGFLLVSPQTTGAETDGETVIIATDDNQCGMEHRIRAELESTGFEVRDVRITSDLPPQRSLKQVSRQNEAVAAVKCSISKGAVEIWVFDRTTSKILVREILLETDGPDADAVVAFRAVELLRASLLELSTTHQVEPEVSPGKPASELAKLRSDELAILKNTEAYPYVELGFTPGLSPLAQDSTVSFGLGIDTSLRVHRNFAIVLLGWIPIVPRRFDEPEGNVRTYQGMVGGGLRVGTKDSRRFTMSFDIGGAAQFVRLIGNGEPGFVGDESFHTTPLLYTGLTPAWRLTDHLKVRLSVMLGWSPTVVNVIVLEEKVAEVGHLFFVATLGFDVRIWR